MLEVLKTTLERLRKSLSDKADIAYAERDAKGVSPEDQAYAAGESHAYGIASDEVRAAQTKGNQPAVDDDQPELSPAAQFALKSLKDHPGDTMLSAIADGQYNPERLTRDEVGEGLVELESLGLAQEEDGQWRLTPRGLGFRP